VSADIGDHARLAAEREDAPKPRRYAVARLGGDAVGRAEGEERLGAPDDVARKDVLKAQDARAVGVRRVVQHVSHVSLLVQSTGVQDRDAVGQGRRLVAIVRDEQRRRRRVGEGLAQVGEQLGPGRRVERREGLVEQQHPGRDGEGAGQAHALCLPA
jgi:hypothetical protein